MGEARDHALYRKVGAENWTDYCVTFLGVPSEAMDELIEGVRILQRKRPGVKVSEAEARKAVMDRAPVLKQRQAGPGRGNKTDNDVMCFSRQGNDTAYLASRIKRDAPDIAARITEFPSMRAAAKAVGIPVEQRISLGNPETVAARILSKGNDYALGVADRAPMEASESV